MENDTNADTVRDETQADIIREMRDLGALDEKSGDMIPRSLQALGLRTYAARLEAAVEREREAAEARQLNECVVVREEETANWRMGNAAAMRAALKAAKTLLENTDFDADSDLDDAAAPVMAQIAAALSAPPRNCDRFKAADEVSAYWNSNVRTVPLPHDAYGMHIDGETYPTFLDWLMAPMKLPVKDPTTITWMSRREIPAIKAVLSEWRKPRSDKSTVQYIHDRAFIAGEPQATAEMNLSDAAWDLEMLTAIDERLRKEARDAKAKA